MRRFVKGCMHESYVCNEDEKPYRVLISAFSSRMLETPNCNDCPKWPCKWLNGSEDIILEVKGL